MTTFGTTTSATSVEPSPQETPGGDRVRESTDPGRQRAIDEELRAHVARYAGASAEDLGRRLRELEEESDIERVLAINASVLASPGSWPGPRDPAS